MSGIDEQKMPECPDCEETVAWNCVGIQNDLIAYLNREEKEGEPFVELIAVYDEERILKLEFLEYFLEDLRIFRCDNCKFSLGMVKNYFYKFCSCVSCCSNDPNSNHNC